MITCNGVFRHEEEEVKIAALLKHVEQSCLYFIKF